LVIKINFQWVDRELAKTARNLGSIGVCLREGEEKGILSVSILLHGLFSEEGNLKEINLGYVCVCDETMYVE